MKKAFIMLAVICLVCFSACVPSNTEPVTKSVEGKFIITKIAETSAHPDLYFITDQDGNTIGASYSKSECLDGGETYVEKTVSTQYAKPVKQDKFVVEATNFEYAYNIFDQNLDIIIDSKELSPLEKYKKLKNLYTKIDVLQSKAYNLINENEKLFLSED